LGSSAANPTLVLAHKRSVLRVTASAGGLWIDAPQQGEAMVLVSDLHGRTLAHWNAGNLDAGRNFVAMPAQRSQWFLVTVVQNGMRATCLKRDFE